MGKSRGFLDANAPKGRDFLSGPAGSPGVAPEAAEAGAATEGGTGADSPAAERPFTGFDRERSTYARLKAELLARAPGQFVVIVGDEVEGPLATFGDAERAGYRRFGFGPLYIKQILAEEPAQEVSRDIHPCRP